MTGTGARSTVIAAPPSEFTTRAVVVVIEAQACWRPPHRARQAAAMKYTKVRKEASSSGPPIGVRWKRMLESPDSSKDWCCSTWLTESRQIYSNHFVERCNTVWFYPDSCRHSIDRDTDCSIRCCCATDSRHCDDVAPVGLIGNFRPLAVQF